MSQRAQQIKRTRRYLFLIFFVASLALVGSMVNGKYGSVVEIVVFTLVGATVASVLLSLLSIPFVLIGVRVWNKYFPQNPTDTRRQAENSD
jgi:hypothetical protein